MLSYLPCTQMSQELRAVALGALGKTYLEQLTSVCQSHWFYKFVRRYEKALNSFFDYLHSVLRPQNGDSSKPCGYCSYKQSCGFGGREQCNLSPFEIPGGRALMPFFVSEKVCNRRDLRGYDQGKACELDYDLLKENGRECQLWPSSQVDLSSVEPPFRQQLNDLKWYSCIPETKFDKNGKKYLVCRCCCFPFKVSPDDNFKCVYDQSLQPAPGMNEL
ncbi:hypothetical protein M3Y98_00269000 [Aphelenchoides besseyi]|nr:hypothetical protein M3Y98_00269000 [Aphelenchoides besseyi]KAI6200932.1 hypothetical protein M3Y96_00787200 [Aphelenchoides besseyi]